MTEARVVSAISRFFFLALLDEHAAFVAAAKATTDWRARILKSPSLTKDGPAVLIATLHDAWQKQIKIPQTGQPVVFSEQEWLVPGDLDLGPWLEFRREGNRDEFFVLLTVKVLRFPVDVVAVGIKESTGTIRHRLGRALRQLGQIQIAPSRVLS